MGIELITKKQASVLIRGLARKLEHPAFKLKTHKSDSPFGACIEIRSAGRKPWNIGYLDLIGLTIEATSSNIFPVKLTYSLEDPDLVCNLRDYLDKLAESKFVKDIATI